MNEFNSQSVTGKLAHGAMSSLGPLVVDCGQWDSDIPAGAWSTGQFQTANRSLPAMACEMNASGMPYLEINLRLDSDVLPERAFMLATEWITSVQRSVPDLALTYDPTHSRSQNGMVVIALVPNTDDPARLERVAQTVRQAGKSCPGATLNSVQWSRAA
jgi:hypothetical protein